MDNIIDILGVLGGLLRLGELVGEAFMQWMKERGGHGDKAGKAVGS